MTREQVIEQQKARPRARMATLAHIRKTIVPLYIEPVPCVQTLRIWFREAGIRENKTGGMEQAGGGNVYFSTAQVEAYLIKRFGILEEAQ